MSIEVTDERDDGRYVITVDGEPVGFLSYELREGQIAMDHAEIDPAREGNGFGGELVGFALRDARERGLDVLPGCPFVRHYIAGHDEFRALVPEAVRGRFGLG